MSELQPQLPAELNNFSALEARKFSNGSNHIYGVNEQGKKTHLKGDNVLAAYGYTPADLPSNVTDAPATVETPVETTTVAPDQDLYNEYANAVKDEAATIRVKNLETGKMDSVKVKDLNFREWLKANETRKAARWYTATRAHGEVPEGEIGDLGNGDEATRLFNREDIERINAREGKANPTQDDIEFYRWLKGNTGETNTDTTTGPQDNGPNDENNDDPTEQTPTVPGIELPAELSETLAAARDEFVRLSSKRRGLITGFGNKKALAAAKLRYEEARDAAGAFVAEELSNDGAEADVVRRFATMGAIAETYQTSGLIYERQMSDSDGKRLKPFYDWWARQGGKFFSKGTVKKAAVMSVIGGGVGFVAGAAGSVVFGPIGGALVGTAIARGVARGLMGAKINKEAGANSVSREQMTSQFANDSNRLRQAAENGDTLTTADVTEGIQNLTDRSIRRNRRRAAIAAVIGAATGFAGAELGQHLLHGGGGGGSHEAASPGSGTTTTTPGAPTPKVPIDNGPVGGPTIEQIPTAPVPKINLLPTDARLPWTHMSSNVGAGEATPTILSAVEKGQAMGFKFNGQTVPGVNNDRILSVTLPDGTFYNDNGHINAAIDYILSQSS